MSSLGNILILNQYTKSISNKLRYQLQDFHLVKFFFQCESLSPGI